MNDPKHRRSGEADSGLELDWGSRRSPSPAEEQPVPTASSALAARFAAITPADPARRDAPWPSPPAPTGREPSPSSAGTSPHAIPTRWIGTDEDSTLEQTLRRWSIPVALVCAWLLVQTRMGQLLAKLFSGMWLHELGHAGAAWFCGRFAFPGPWRTAVGEERSWPVVLCVSAAIVYLGLRLRALEQPGWYRIPATLLSAQLFATLFLRPSGADLVITFAGDAGAMLVGAALMMTFYASANSQLRRGWLRWGFLVLGALAFMETADTWWDAVGDSDRIPFGEIEGVGASDPTKLSDVHGWSTRGMVRAYVGVSVVALLALAVAYVRGLRANEEHGA